MSLEEAFLSRLKDAVQNSDCIEWQNRVKGVYGQFGYNYKKYYAHRVAWEIHNNAEIPKGKVVMHTCDNPSCVNPDHLRLGTQADNVKDMIDKGRENYTYDRDGESNSNCKVKAELVPLIYQADGKHSDIAKKYDCPLNAVIGIRNNCNWKHITKDLKPGKRGVSGLQGSQIGSARLNESDAAKMYTSNERNRILAERYNCSISVVQRIKKGETWRHVTKDLTRG